MADDPLERFEAVLGAISRMTSDEEQANQLEDVKCPKCDASSFVKVSDVYDEAVRRLDYGTATEEARADLGGFSDRRIIEDLGPPRRRSAVAFTIAFALPLLAGAFYVYRRFGDIPGQGALIAALVATAVFFMTRVRKLSDQYYDRRNRYNKTFLCRRCGQRVAP